MPDTQSSSNLGRNIAIGLAVIAAIGFGGYQYIISQPTARGSARCFIQQTFFEAHDPGPPNEGAPVLTAVAETDVVRDPCDAADDPAIYFNESAPEKSLILGTNKARGVNVYNLSGKELFHFPDGAINNIDIRSNYEVAGQKPVLVGGSDKAKSQIKLWRLNTETGELTNALAAPINAKVEKETYGFCLYNSIKTGKLYGIVPDKSGAVEQWLLTPDASGQFTGKFERKLKVSSQPEGCVADDANGRLFVGEEDVGIWAFDAEPTSDAKGELIAKTGYGKVDGAWLTEDVEGLAMYIPDANDTSNGFIVASSQGNDTYAIFDRNPPYAYKGAFQVSANGAIVGDTDGLAVHSGNFGPKFPKGLVVVQDGVNETPDRSQNYQNFKLVSWADYIAKGKIAH